MKNKTVFITGASQGIGEATARELANSGSNVVLAARNEGLIEKIAAEIGSKALAVKCDVSRYKEVEAAMEKAANHFGGIDILVNNAGVIEPIARLEDSDPEQWSKVVDINLKGVYNCLHAAFKYLKESKGVAINMSSGAAISALEGWSHYCSTKAAVLSLTKCAHREWTHFGIRVVGLSPGTVATDMQASIRSSGINPVSRLNWEEHIPAEWVGKAVAWLATDDATEFDGSDFSLKTPEAKRMVGLAV